MLTKSFLEIISVIKDQIDANTIENISSEDIGNINLMLRGYLGLIQSEFKTQDDTDEPSSPYYAQLKNVLAKLTQVQRDRLHKTKQSLMDGLFAELNYINHQMDTFPLLKNPTNQKLMTEYKACYQLLQSKLNEYVHDVHSGFIQSIRIGMELTSKMANILDSLKKQTAINDISVLKEQLQHASTTYLKKLTVGYNKEKDNQQCESYLISGEFMDLLTNG